MNHIEELFSENFEPGYFKLIDRTHPLSLYIGADNDGHYAIEYRGDFNPIKVKSSTAIGVMHYVIDTKKRTLYSIVALSNKGSHTPLGTSATVIEN